MNALADCGERGVEIGEQVCFLFCETGVVVGGGRGEGVEVGLEVCAGAAAGL